MKAAAFGAVLALGVALVTTIWLLAGLLRARFGVGADAARELASVGIISAIWLAGWTVGLGRPPADPQARWRAAQQHRAWRRRARPWLVLYLVSVLVASLADAARAASGAAAAPGGSPANLGLFAFVWVMMADLLQRPFARLPADEDPAGERQDAMRWGYVVLVTLGLANLVVMGPYPLLAARAWVPILILGVLVPQVRLVVLARASAREA